jgi:DNA-binding NtrC family response regulator
MKPLSALIVEDKRDFRESMALLVEREGYAPREAGSLSEARDALAADPPDLILLDLDLPDGDGMEIFEEEALAESTEVVLMTGNVEFESAITALRAGAFDYLPKPVDRDRLRVILANLARTRGLKREISELRETLRSLGRFGEMVGRSKQMTDIYDLISRVAPTGSTVFVTGESGTGKELVAETVHRLSGRKEKPFLTLNCGAIPANLIESELFGHEKGAFTGADKRRKGYFEEADGGTLFLDEITEMPIELQVKLLRVLETGAVTRVGATAPTAVDVRIVAASNRDPLEAIEEGRLREDLYYRLNVFPIDLPPLREREGDVELLAQHFLDALNAREGTAKRLGESGIETLRRLEWPGNVRQLKNIIERAWILADELIGPESLPEPEEGAVVERDGAATLQVPVGESIEAVERRLILATLDELDGDKKRAAEILGISVKTLYNRLNVYDAADS